MPLPLKKQKECCVSCERHKSNYSSMREIALALDAACPCHQAKPECFCKSDRACGATCKEGHLDICPLYKLEGNNSNPPEVSPEKKECEHDFSLAGNLIACRKCGKRYEEIAPKKEKDCCTSLKQKMKEDTRIALLLLANHLGVPEKTAKKEIEIILNSLPS